MGVKAIVKKKREVWILNNIRFHIDDVEELGKFIEIEARGETEKDLAKLRNQVEKFINEFDIKKDDFIKGSYSDLIIEKRKQ